MNKPFKILSQLGNWPKFAQPIQGSYQDILALKPTVRPPHLLCISVPQSWNQNVSTGEARIRSCRSVCCGPHAARNRRGAHRPWAQGRGHLSRVHCRARRCRNPGQECGPARVPSQQNRVLPGTDVNESGAPPSETQERPGAEGRELGWHAPRCCSVSDWTRESSHLGFEAGGGRGRSQNTPLTPLWPLIGPRSRRVRFWKARFGAPSQARLRIGCSRERFGPRL